MADDERLLLENVLDVLDRLFDGHCGVVDVWALLVATGAALRGTPHRAAVVQPITALWAVVRSGADAAAQRDQALGITDPLRLYLAAVLPEPSLPLPDWADADSGTATDRPEATGG